MGLYDSKFAYVPYDGEHGRAQNALRNLFISLENDLLKGNLEQIRALKIEQNEYFTVTEETKYRISGYFSRGRKDDALVELEVLYTLMGKSLRNSMIKKLETGNEN